MTFKEALAVGFFGSLCFLILPAYSCDCAFFADSALARIGIKLKTFPAIIWTEAPPGYRRGVVNVPANSSCMVYVHEFVHHDQWEHGLEALSMGDAVWWRLEKNAEKLTRDAMEHQSTCVED